MGCCIDLIDSAERAQFRVAFQENAELVLDMLEMMRVEAAHSAEPDVVRFVSGIADTISAFLHAYGGALMNASDLAPKQEQH